MSLLSPGTYRATIAPDGVITLTPTAEQPAPTRGSTSRAKPAKRQQLNDLASERSTWSAIRLATAAANASGAYYSPAALTACSVSMRPLDTKNDEDGMLCRALYDFAPERWRRAVVKRKGIRAAHHVVLYAMIGSNPDTDVDAWVGCFQHMARAFEADEPIVGDERLEALRRTMKGKVGRSELERNLHEIAGWLQYSAGQIPIGWTDTYPFPAVA